MLATGVPDIGLDSSGEPWRGTFAGLGEVRVDADGTVDVTPAEDGADPDTREHRAAALRHGWGEALSWARRGVPLFRGSALTPDPEVGCVLMTGDLHEMGRLFPVFAERGWGFLSDRYTPAEWRDTGLWALPRSAPILLAARHAGRSGLAGDLARGTTDAVAVGVQRVVAPSRVIAVLDVVRTRPDEATFEQLAGHRRFQVAAGLRCRGVLAGATADGPDAAGAPDLLLEEHLRLATLPMALLRTSGRSEQLPHEADTVAHWWTTMTEGAA